MTNFGGRGVCVGVCVCVCVCVCVERRRDKRRGEGTGRPLKVDLLEMVTWDPGCSLRETVQYSPGWTESERKREREREREGCFTAALHTYLTNAKKEEVE